MSLPAAKVVASATATPVSERDRLGSIALDQWRGLALVLVLISHGFFFTDRVNGIGRVGVNLFFFISGILVFRSLSRSRAKSDFARTRSFWWRRFRRLYPAVITYVMAMLPIVWLLQYRPGLPLDSDFSSYLKAIPVAIFYVANYFEPPMALGHLWSLACEMQFYLIAPIIYLLGGRTDQRRHLVFGCLLVLLMGVGASQPFIGKWKYHFEFAVWPMMLGFCCEYKRHWFNWFSHSTVTALLWSAVAVCGVSISAMLAGMETKPLVVATGALLLAPCLVAYLYGRPMPKFAGPAMKWLGERTYSIYLWQQPFTICNYIPNVLHPLGSTAAVAVGGVWFHWFEWPFLSTSRRAVEIHPPPRRAGKWKWPAIGFAVLAVLLFTSFWMLRQHYEHRLARQIYPVAAPRLSVVANAPAHFDATVLLLGDSRMVQWGVPQLPDWRVVNGAVGGSTTGQLRLAAPKLLEKIHPNVVVLETGINDLKYLGIRPELSAQIVSLATSNLTAVVRECVAHQCKVIVLDTWPAGTPSLARRLVWNAAVAKSVVQLNARLRGLNSPKHGIYVVDLLAEARLKGEPGLYRDTLHFNQAVYRHLTPVLQRELKRFLPSEKKMSSDGTKRRLE